MTDAYLSSESPIERPQVAAIEPLIQLSWIDTFAGILIQPIQTLRQLAAVADERFNGIGGAAAVVILAFGLDGLRMVPPQNLLLAWLYVPFSIFLGLMLWLSMAGFYSLTASIFGAPTSRCQRAFVLIGWSFAPWTLMAPIGCYRELLGPAFIVVAAIPFIWTFIMQVLAVRESFELRSMQVLALFVVVPALYQAQQILSFIQGLFATVSSMM